LKYLIVTLSEFGQRSGHFFINYQEEIPLKLKTSSLLIAGALFGAAVLPAQANNDAMTDLLKVLRDQGTITSENYELLSNASKADAEYVESVKISADKAEANESSLKNLAWAEKVKLEGDVRFRYEDTNNPDGAGETANRLRIRARVGAYADINEQTKAGFRIVSTTGDATSTNQTLSNNFESRDVGWDLAYIDFAPTALGGDTNFIFGKMKQPWVKVNDVIWDGDTNPEGVAVTSDFKMDGFTLTPSVGYYVLQDNGNLSFTEDSHLVHAQFAVKMGKKDKTKFGLSYFGFENANSVNDEERMYELFGETPIPGTPLTAFGSYVTNNNADAAGDDDNAFSLGAKAKFGDFKTSYEYRDLGINAVNANFANSDFVSDSDGHILKAGYKIDENFDLGATYFITEDNAGNDTRDRNRFQLDLKAKF
jgi:hypothetical protein